MCIYHYIFLFSEKGIFKNPYISEDIDKSMIPTFPHQSIETLILASWKQMLKHQENTVVTDSARGLAHGDQLVFQILIYMHFPMGAFKCLSMRLSGGLGRPLWWATVRSAILCALGGTAHVTSLR